MSRLWTYAALVAALMLMFFSGMHAETWRHSQESYADRGDDADLNKDVADTLTRQVDAWNAGDIDAFMAGYIDSENLRFASAGKVKRGWQTTRDGYFSRYPDRAAMGKLAFTELEFTSMSKQDVMVFGKWRLSRTNDSPGGLFTLHMRKIDGGWKILSDHTSSE